MSAGTAASSPGGGLQTGTRGGLERRLQPACGSQVRDGAALLPLTVLPARSAGLRPASPAVAGEIAPRLLRIVAVSAALTLTACDTDNTLPGRSRPIFEHDWPDPGEVLGGPSAFIPPDPGEALFEASSGVRAYIVPAETDPLVRITVALPLGRLHEREGEAGASALLTHLLTTRGAAGAGDPLSLRLAELGTSLSAVETLDATHLSLNVLPEDWRAGLELLVGLLRGPDLDARTIRASRAGAGYAMPMAGIVGAGYRPKVELERFVLGYPLAPPEPGMSVPLAAVRALAARSLAADRVVFGIGGAVIRAEAEGALESATDGWAASGEPAPEPAVIEPGEPSSHFHAVDVPSLEGWIAIGRVVGAVPETDRAPLAVLRFILAERLNIAAREKRGLANRDDFEIPETASGTGLLLVRTGGRPEAVGPLVRYSLDEIARMHDPDTPVTGTEVVRARGWLLGAAWQRSLELATDASRTFAVEAVRYGSADRLMNWPDAVRAVTAADVERVAQEYLDPVGFTTVVAGPLAEIRAARHPRWPVSLDDLEAELSGEQ
ncbi:MAG: insulinase family protein [Acidobacteria bacterium]|nr:insulinase family protein [Acidobacteriota bacterium]MYH22715.1 insulinase family protein [Acidobacteriota bacterium]MYK79902.1 insulinase family protein [Acidobacteriota bacterium]